MEADGDRRDGRPLLTRAGMASGIRRVMPYTPTLCVMGLLIGALAAQKGLTLLEILAMSAFVYAGATQLIAVQLWPETWTWTTFVTVVGLTAALNARLFLMTASLRPWLGRLPARHVYPHLLVVIDSTWAISIRYRAEGGTDPGILVGPGILSWFIWVAAVPLGYLTGAGIADPKAFGLDLMVMIIFVTMMVPVVRRATHLRPLFVAAGTGLAASWALPGFWFVILGALAGALTAAWMGDDA